MDIGTGIGTGLALFGSKDIIIKILGPTADYIGSGIKNFTEKRVDNIKNIFISAEKKLGNKINTPGVVSPRVLRGILNEGSFCNDFLYTEYFGGVLASSRSDISRDDRGASIIALISRLSTYQIRSHYIFYSTIKSIYNDTNLSVTDSVGRQLMRTHIPMPQYQIAMQFEANEHLTQILSHVMFGLSKENLIESIGWAYGDKMSLEEKGRYKVPSDGILLIPSALGVELFLWAHGKADIDINNFFSRNIIFEIDERIMMPKNCLHIP
jgi:hypothetical protein